MKHAPFLFASSFTGNNLMMSSGLPCTELPSNDFPVTEWFLCDISFDRLPLLMSFSHLCPLHSQYWTSFLKLIFSPSLNKAEDISSLSLGEKGLFIMLVPSLPSCLLRCESCLQVQLSDLPTKAEDNLTFMLGRLNFVQAPAWLPKHISLCFRAFRKAIQFIFLVNSSGHIVPVTASGPLIPTLPETPCL